MEKETEAEPKKKKGKKKKLFKILAICLAGVIVVLTILGIAGVFNSQPSDLRDLPEAEYKAEAVRYSVQEYDDLKRNPEKHSGKLAVMTAKVIQIISSGSEKQLRVYLMNDPVSASPDCAVYVRYQKEGNFVNIIENDVVTIYGELKGNQEYQTVLGAKLSIPLIWAKYIELAQNPYANPQVGEVGQKLISNGVEYTIDSVVNGQSYNSSSIAGHEYLTTTTNNFVIVYATIKNANNFEVTIYDDFVFLLNGSSKYETELASWATENHNGYAGFVFNKAFSAGTTYKIGFIFETPQSTETQQGYSINFRLQTNILSPETVYSHVRIAI